MTLNRSPWLLQATLLAACALPFTAHAIPAGVYQITGKQSQKCVDIKGPSTSNGAAIHQWSCHAGDSQKWRVTAVGDAYQLQSVYSGKCLDVTERAYDNGTSLQQWSCTRAEHQLFYIDPQSDGHFRIRAKHSNAAVDIAERSIANGAALQQWQWWGGDNQRFAFKSVGGNTGGSPTSKPVWSENFENLGNGRWLGQNYTEVRNGCGTGGGKCVRVTYVPSSEGSPRVVMRQNLPPAREYTLNYDVMFENGFDFVKGGKLPGLGPNDVVAGCRASTPQGWSARVMWRTGGIPVIYSYSQNRPNRCGEDIYSQTQFQPGRYHAVSLYVKVNDPALANGKIDVYLDGRRIATQNNVQLRAVGGSHTEVTRFLFDTFFGGSDSSWSPRRNVYSRFDNFAVYPGLRVRSSPGQ